MAAAYLQTLRHRDVFAVGLRPHYSDVLFSYVTLVLTSLPHANSMFVGSSHLGTSEGFCDTFSMSSATICRPAPKW